ncbi:T9SS type B sorting domain-containing protein [Mucilaginibacter pocheonensis]|uniref:Gliding motility-associated-like protein n=1 Tax=Mucilaginibacter pocheonensis TaxID=398050 RepID=A0ABU1T512_9SPHI|nr:gliding motility-associated C-terminal domain-containing protein [Mucilaginibacter pocheonensis]MDR6940495.1 gliding motility-associated-like protein [Mucilaginibacter pocheonensis]
MHPRLSILRVTALLLVSINFFTGNLFAQAPVIKYTTPHRYIINTPITSLAPTNTGGAVPATIYGQVSTIAGNTGISGSANGPAQTATFKQPLDVAIDASGNIYVVDFSMIRKITPFGTVEPFVGSETVGFEDGTGADARFSEGIFSLAIDKAGNIYAADTYAIRKITPSGIVSTLAGSNYPGFLDETGTAARFTEIRGITLDDAGNIYACDFHNNCIRKITPAGVVTTVTGNGAFVSAYDVVIDAVGNMFVCDGAVNKIKKITPAGVVSTFAGSGAADYVDGSGTSAAFSAPSALAIDKAGNIYVCDAILNQRIRKITPDGQVTTFAGNGNIGFEDGISTNASFRDPYGIGIDKEGSLFIADTHNYAIRKINTSGYAIDKALPAGLTFDQKTGAITGTPAILSPPIDYTITAYNGNGSGSAIVNIAVIFDIVKQPSIITFPPQTVGNIDADNILHPDATSTNKETPITYTSSNPEVAYIGADGNIHVIAPGVTTITAHQNGNENYTDATPVARIFTIMQDQVITFPPFAVKSTCDADFQTGASTSNSTIPLTYFSSNTAVATVSTTGKVHIVGSGNTIITVSQSGNNLYNAALPQSQPLTVTALVTPSVSITPDFYSSCEGLSVSYEAKAINAGAHPTYQWFLNGQSSGNNSDTYISSSLKTGDVITCMVTNNDGCIPVVSALSNPATLKSDPYVTLALTITSSASGAVLIGTPITFKANLSANLQDNPVYQWLVNGQNAGTNSPNFTTRTLLNGDVVTCNMIAGGACIINPSVFSNTITVAITIPEKIIVPNTFTPNADGYNDTWEIAALLTNTNCTINIYNRYGAIVYRSVGYQQPWNGDAAGKPLPMGTYYYIIDPKNGSPRLSGPVTIIR